MNNLNTKIPFGINMMIKLRIIRTFLYLFIRISIQLCVIVGAILSLVYFDCRFLLMGVPALLRPILLTSNIPILSTLARRFEWLSYKLTTIKKLQTENPIISLPVAVYLQTNKDIKNIFIYDGIKSFHKRLNEETARCFNHINQIDQFIKEQNENTFLPLLEQLNNGDTKMSQEEFTNLLRENLESVLKKADESNIFNQPNNNIENGNNKQ